MNSSPTAGCRPTRSTPGPSITSAAANDPLAKNARCGSQNAHVNFAIQVGRTLDLFDWTGVSPTGAFAISSPYVWDLSNLYTTGEVTLTAIPEPSTLALASAAAFVVGVSGAENRGRRPLRPFQ